MGLTFGVLAFIGGGLALAAWYTGKPFLSLFNSFSPPPFTRPPLGGGAGSDSARARVEYFRASGSTSTAISASEKTGLLS